MPFFKIAVRSAALSLLATGLSMGVSMAEETPAIDQEKVVVAKLLILPGNNMPAGMSDLNSPAREISLDGALESSSSHNVENDQNNRTDILDDANLGKVALGIFKPAKSSRVKRRSVNAKTQRVKIAGVSISRQTVKRRAPIMLGVYR